MWPSVSSFNRTWSFGGVASIACVAATSDQRIGDVDVAVGSERHVIWLVHVRLIVAGLIRRADGHQDFSVVTELPDSLGLCVDDPGIAGIIEADGVSVFEHPFTPRLYKLSFR